MSKDTDTLLGRVHQLEREVERLKEELRRREMDIKVLEEAARTVVQLMAEKASLPLPGQQRTR